MDGWRRRRRCPAGVPVPLWRYPPCCRLVLVRGPLIGGVRRRGERLTTESCRGTAVHPPGGGEGAGTNEPVAGDRSKETGYGHGSGECRRSGFAAWFRGVPYADGGPSRAGGGPWAGLRRYQRNAYSEHPPPTRHRRRDAYGPKLPSVHCTVGERHGARAVGRPQGYASGAMNARAESVERVSSVDTPNACGLWMGCDLTLCRRSSGGGRSVQLGYVVVGGRWSVVGGWWLVVGGWWSVVGGRLRWLKRITGQREASARGVSRSTPFEGIGSGAGERRGGVFGYRLSW
ncbi:hypothetical protein FA13DRAFT_1390190 [Coprinellus micaceus]|uniref:Uncharacterized protein n=1 Tax=Coprinellus micaceus TaxID=71717 RepID=A0A4Y7SR05_COPMI|nr:hypothetical protein FA13DRAFT_1390190 [Coprinellus micaceus]